VREEWKFPSVGGAWVGPAVLALACLALAGPAAEAQEQEAGEARLQTADAVQARASRTIQLVEGNSLVVTYPSALTRLSIGSPEVADAVVVSEREVVVNGKTRGSTTLLAWDQAGGRHLYRVRVTPDVESLEAGLASYFPEEEIRVSSTGNSVVLEGRVEDPRVAEKAVALASQMTEVSVLDNIVVPERGQVLLRVRFAEVNRSAMKDLGASLLRVDPLNVRGDDEVGITPNSFGDEFLEGDGPEQSFSDMANLFLFHRGSNIGAFIRALRTRGQFKSLAEPNLLVTPGDSASFLAGGEFPFPALQSADADAVTVEFREFGIRLGFAPQITNSGAIRLRVAPEVSQLDFNQGVLVAGVQVPAILSRRAETAVELREGQTLAIAGLIDNTLMENVQKVPVLGDIPILGSLFRSKQMQQNRTELLVLVTPQLVLPEDEQPPLPTGEPETWQWDKSLEDFPVDGPSIRETMGGEATDDGEEN